MLTDADLQAVDARLAADAGALMQQIAALEAQGNDYTKALIGIKHSRTTIAELRVIHAEREKAETNGKAGDLQGESATPPE